MYIKTDLACKYFKTSQLDLRGLLTDYNIKKISLYKII